MYAGFDSTSICMCDGGADAPTANSANLCQDNPRNSWKITPKCKGFKEIAEQI